MDIRTTINHYIEEIKTLARGSEYRFFGVILMACGALLWALMLTVLDEYDTASVLLWVGIGLFVGGFACWEIGLKRAGHDNAGPDQDKFLDP